MAILTKTHIVFLSWPDTRIDINIIIYYKYHLHQYHYHLYQYHPYQCHLYQYHCQTCILNSISMVDTYQHQNDRINIKILISISTFHLGCFTCRGVWTSPNSEKKLMNNSKTRARLFNKMFIEYSIFLLEQGYSIKDFI